MEPLLGATSEAYDNSVAVQLHRYGDSTAIPEALDSHAAPLWITDTPNRSHTASEAAPSALTLLPRARLYAAVAVFTAIATLYATIVLSTHWFRPHRRSEQILASLQAAPVVAALAAEGLLQSGMLPNAKHCNGQLGRCEFNRCTTQEPPVSRIHCHTSIFLRFNYRTFQSLTETANAKCHHSIHSES